MKIDERVLKLLEANCMTLGWDINEVICRVMINDFCRDNDAEDLIASQWADLHYQLKDERNAEE